LMRYLVSSRRWRVKRQYRYRNLVGMKRKEKTQPKEKPLRILFSFLLFFF